MVSVRFVAFGIRGVMNRTCLAVVGVGLGLGLGCNLDLHTGARLERGMDAASSVGDATWDAGVETTTQTTPDGATIVVVDTFFPPMFVTVDGVLKRYRLSAYYAIDPTNPAGARIEFASGSRNLGSEATPGEIYSEVWLFFTRGRGVPGTYACTPSGADPLAPAPLTIAWSFNHIDATTRHDYYTSVSGGPCTATLQDFGTMPGDRLRGTFSATVEGGHTLSNGMFDLVLPTLVPITGN